MSQATWLIYGAYGYTGEALAREAASRGLRPVLAGRRPERLAPLARELGLEARAFALDDPAALRAGLEGVALVAHCAGPFLFTATPMRAACLEAGAHYLDITGEIDVFVATRALAEAARTRGVVLMSGTGFDVVPSDCLALHLKQRLPGARRLELAFQALGGGVSPGTSKTMLEGLGEGGRIRRGGEIVPVPTAWRSRQVPFSSGTRSCVSIPWGDVATAGYSTGIPDIVVYTAMPTATVRWLQRLRPFEGLLALAPLKALARRWIERRVHGPTPAQRQAGRATLWGRVEDDAGGVAEATLDTPEGYRLTVLATLEVARRVLAGELEGGAWTPAEAFGADFVLGFPEVVRRDL